MADTDDVPLPNGTILHFPAGTSAEKKRAYIQKNFPDQVIASGGGDPTATPSGQFVRGMGRGAVGLATSAADINNALLPGGAAYSRLEQPARDWATDPNVSETEKAGRFTSGVVLPLAAQPEMGMARGAALSALYGTSPRWLPAAARLAEDSLWGLTGGMMQPTQSGTLESHLSGGASGAAAGLAQNLVGGALQSRIAAYVGRRVGIVGQHAAIAEAMHLFGVPWEYVATAVGPWTIWRLMHNTPITNLARRTPAVLGRDIKNLPPGVLGGIAGRYSTDPSEDEGVQSKQQPDQSDQPPQQQQDRPQDFKWLPSR